MNSDRIVTYLEVFMVPWSVSHVALVQFGVIDLLAGKHVEQVWKTGLVDLTLRFFETINSHGPNTLHSKCQYFGPLPHISVAQDGFHQSVWNAYTMASDD